MRINELNKQQFDALWERASVRDAVSGLSDEYGVWQAKRSKRLRIAGVIAVLCVVSAVAFLFLPSSDNAYNSIACNRNGFSGDYWIRVVNDNLVSEL